MMLHEKYVGRDIYINSGSHGCINTIPSLLEAYIHKHVNLPVVVYR